MLERRTDNPVLIFAAPTSCAAAIVFSVGYSSILTASCLTRSVGLGQRTNVISCVTVHDSDSSTASPLTPLPRTLNPAAAASRQARTLAVVAPSVKSQAAVSHARLDSGESHIPPHHTHTHTPLTLLAFFPSAQAAVISRRLLFNLIFCSELHETEEIIQPAALQLGGKHRASSQPQPGETCGGVVVTLTHNRHFQLKVTPVDIFLQFF